MAVTTINADFGYRRVSMAMDLEPVLDCTILDFLQGKMLYEPDVSHAMLHALRDGDVAIDVGANVGFFTVLSGMLVGPTGRVVSFEPGDDNIARLQANIGLNKLHNVTLVPQPASDAPGPVGFYTNTDASGGHALWDPGVFPGNVRSHANPQLRQMTATTLDAEVARLGLPVPRLIKIDTEGAEHRVLQGACGLLEGRKVPFVIAELHEFGLQKLGSSQQDLRRFMAGFGYATFAVYWDGALPKLIPPGTILEPPFIINLLFSTPEDVATVWGVERFDPRATFQPRR